MKIWSLHQPPRRVRVGPISSEALSRNPSRFYAEIRNCSKAPIWFSAEATAKVGQGTRLRCGEMKVFDALDPHLTMGIQVINEGGPDDIEVIEGV